MIKINDVNKVNDLKTAKTPKASGGESFSGGAISVADAIFAAQMVDADEEKEVRKKLIKRGQTLLEKLEEIRDGLLMGYISRDRLIEISRLVKDNRYQSEDPRLQEILGEIELRVEVELAKLMK